MEANLIHENENNIYKLYDRGKAEGINLSLGFVFFLPVVPLVRVVLPNSVYLDMGTSFGSSIPYQLYYQKHGHTGMQVVKHVQCNAIYTNSMVVECLIQIFFD